jgi:hypothetical protein
VVCGVHVVPAFGHAGSFESIVLSLSLLFLLSSFFFAYWLPLGCSLVRTLHFCVFGFSYIPQLCFLSCSCCFLHSYLLDVRDVQISRSEMFCMMSTFVNFLCYIPFFILVVSFFSGSTDNLFSLAGDVSDHLFGFAFWFV